MIYIDPHGDASLQLAMMQDNWKEVVILDPLYTTYALNPLELPPLPQPGSSSYRRERTMAVQNQVEQMSIVMREMFSTSSEQAPRLMWMLKGALYYLYSETDPANIVQEPDKSEDDGTTETENSRELAMTQEDKKNIEVGKDADKVREAKRDSLPSAFWIHDNLPRSLLFTE